MLFEVNFPDNHHTPLNLLTLVVTTAQPFQTPPSLLRLVPSTGRKSAPEVSFVWTLGVIRIVSSRDLTVIANDDILYSRTLQDCERFCDDVSRILKGIPPSLIFNISRPELSIVGVLLKKETDVI